jgi:hypothetical protein
MRNRIKIWWDWLWREILRNILDREFSPQEDDALKDAYFKRPDLTWLIICTDIWAVHDFNVHFRSQVMGIIAAWELPSILPLNLWIVFTWEKSEVSDMIDLLRQDINEILGDDLNPIWIELLALNELKRRKIMVSWGCETRASDLLHVIEARWIDDDTTSISRNRHDWKDSPHQSLRSHLKSTNSRFVKPKWLFKNK